MHECDFKSLECVFIVITTRCDYVCDYNTHECDFNTQKIDFYKQNTHRV
jgi:hypothetical protein